MDGSDPHVCSCARIAILSFVDMTVSGPARSPAQRESEGSNGLARILRGRNARGGPVGRASRNLLQPQPEEAMTTDSSDSIATSDNARTPVKQQMHAVGEEMRQLGKVSKETVKEELQAVRERGEQAVQHAKERVGEWEGTLTAAVREQPIRSLLFAAGAGLVLGFFLRR